MGEEINCNMDLRNLFSFWHCINMFCLIICGGGKLVQINLCHFCLFIKGILFGFPEEQVYAEITLKCRKFILSFLQKYFCFLFIFSIIFRQKFTSFTIFTLQLLIFFQTIFFSILNMFIRLVIIFINAYFNCVHHQKLRNPIIWENLRLIKSLLTIFEAFFYFSFFSCFSLNVTPIIRAIFHCH